MVCVLPSPKITGNVSGVSLSSLSCLFSPSVCICCRTFDVPSPGIFSSTSIMNQGNTTASSSANTKAFPRIFITPLLLYPKKYE